MSLLTRVFYYLLVSAMWGCTNPFLKAAQLPHPQEEQADDQSQASSSSLRDLFIKIFTNYRFFLPIAINQSGSLVFYYLLSTEPISLAVPVVNTLTMLFTFFTGLYLGETIRSVRNFAFGSLLILMGTFLCLT